MECETYLKRGQPRKCLGKHFRTAKQFRISSIYSNNSICNISFKLVFEF